MAVTSPEREAALWAAWPAVLEHADGLYLSFESDDDPRRINDAFPTATLSRLLEIKAAWDPDDVFAHDFDVTRTASPARTGPPDRPVAPSR
jgi:hypothetical protein